MHEPMRTNAVGRFFHRIGVVVGAIAFTISFFLVLPVIQAISKGPDTGIETIQTDTVNLPPPPPPPQDEPEPEPEEEPEPPELVEEAAPLDLSQLELALNANAGGGWLGGDFAVKLDNIAQQADQVDSLFSMSDLDQKPRIIYQPGPVLSAKLRQRAPGTVYVLFVVNDRGRVEQPTVQESTDPIFERPALNAVKQWKFEPGKRNGKPVRFRMRVPVTFPKG